MRRLLKHSLVYLLGDVLVRAGSFLLIPLYTRTLSRSEYGVLAIVSLLVAVVATLAGLSLSSAVLKLNPEHRSKNEGKKLVNSITLFVILWALVLGTVLFLFAPSLISHYLHEESIERYCRLAIITGCLSGVTGVLLAVFQSNEQPIRYRLVTVVAFAANIITAIVAVVLLRLSLLGAVLGLLAGAGCGFLIALKMVGIEVGKTFDRGVLSSSLNIGIPLTLYALGGLATDQLSRVFIERYISSSTLGVYNIAYLYCTPLSVIFIAINTAWVPKFFGGSLAEDHARISGLYGTALVIAAVGIAGAMSILSPDILGLVVPPEYHAAQRFIPGLMFNAVLSTPVWTVVMNPLILRNRNWSITWCALASGLCNVVLNVYLTKRLGVSGAVLSSMGALLMLNGLVAAHSLRAYHIPYRYTRIIAGVAITAMLYKMSLWAVLLSPGAALAMRATVAAVCGGIAFLLIPGCLSLISRRDTIG